MLYRQCPAYDVHVGDGEREALFPSSTRKRRGSARGGGRVALPPIEVHRECIRHHH